jgi:hypothetical protein
MSDEQPRTDAISRERSPDHQYTLSVEQVTDLYDKAGLPRSPRAIQKYCALSKLDCHKVETETGEKYLVAPYSVERHIAYINEVRTGPNNRDKSRPVANVRIMENKVGEEANTREQPRTDTALREPEDRYIVGLERENEFLRGQIGVVDPRKSRCRQLRVLSCVMFSRSFNRDAIPWNTSQYGSVTSFAS